MPTQEQLDQWRRDFEAARSFEDDDLWLPPPTTPNGPSSPPQPASRSSSRKTPNGGAPNGVHLHPAQPASNPATTNLLRAATAALIFEFNARARAAEGDGRPGQQQTFDRAVADAEAEEEETRTRRDAAEATRAAAAVERRARDRPFRGNGHAGDNHN
jgi:hypothetical protein